MDTSTKDRIADILTAAQAGGVARANAIVARRRANWADTPVAAVDTTSRAARRRTVRGYWKQMKTNHPNLRLSHVVLQSAGEIS